MATTSTIAPAEALQLSDLITPAAHGIASRILSKTGGGSLTLFAFDAGQGLAELNSGAHPRHGGTPCGIGGTDHFGDRDDGRAIERGIDRVGGIA